MTTITPEYWLEISRDLEQHHALFYQCWGMGRPILTDRIKTACIAFNRAGEYVEFCFNPEFWNSIDHYTRLFVISHECLHVILNHGLRTTNNKDMDRINATLDVVVNHLLIRCFGFDREKINGHADLCWIDTVYPEEYKYVIPDNEAYEFYYRLLPLTPVLHVRILDDHSMLGGDWEKVIGKLNDNLSEEEKRAIRGIIEKHYQGEGKKGEVDTGKWTFLHNEPITRQRKWENVIKEWSLKFLKDDIQHEEQWARIARRLQLLPEEILLPSEMEVDWLEKDRMPVFLFLDTSGSCRSYKERFWKAGASLPPERFDVRMFCFDDVVMETTLESRKIREGGGTSFNIIENHIQHAVKTEGIEYPEAVFIITDGHGDHVQPLKPQNWYWFLTNGGSQGYVPQKSKTFWLRDYQ